MTSAIGPGNSSAEHYYVHVYEEPQSEDDPEARKIWDWVCEVERQTSNTKRLSVIMDFPEAHISPQELFQQTIIPTQFVALFNYFAVKDLRVLITWMIEQTDPTQFQDEISGEEYMTVLSRISPLKLLYDVLEISMINKGLQTDKILKPDFKILKENFAALIMKGLVTQ